MQHLKFPSVSVGVVCSRWNMLPLLLTGGFLQRRDADLRSRMSFEWRFLYRVFVTGLLFQSHTETTHV